MKISTHNNTPAEFILAGYERGGTTLLSDLFRANGFESGFECGVLLGSSPSDFPKISPYWDMLIDGWNIDANARSEAIKGDFSEFYISLRNSAFPEFRGRIFDKTPKYMECLGLCLNRAEFLKGAVIIHRDPRAVFVSMARRLSPGLSVAESIEKNFRNLTDRYLSYFIGSAAHLNNPKVMFIPFEDIVSRKSTWLHALGLFVEGRPFKKRKSTSRFGNVEKNGMDLNKIVEFDQLLSQDLQKRILYSTKTAAIFFASPVERAYYCDEWYSILHQAQSLLQHFEINEVNVTIDGVYFEPLTYLIRYQDVLKARVNPIVHYRNRGRSEGRRPA